VSPSSRLAVRERKGGKRHQPQDDITVSECGEERVRAPVRKEWMSIVLLRFAFEEGGGARSPNSYFSKTKPKTTLKDLRRDGN